MRDRPRRSWRPAELRGDGRQVDLLDHERPV